jgi:hypothetical protein
MAHARAFAIVGFRQPILESGLESGAISAVLVVVTNLWEWPRWNLVQAAHRTENRCRIFPVFEVKKEI